MERMYTYSTSLAHTTQRSVAGTRTIPGRESLERFSEAGSELIGFERLRRHLCLTLPELLDTIESLRDLC
ncbi:unnamed protein product [Rodentolepis nana]|uniref:Uncharacterized protein n=1 Tax=Rodentolepis nana TaxID=102285 RepID=A0A3P7W697_RODNA|nr:unnamed protein product [Rodentolepis nana]